MAVSLFGGAMTLVSKALTALSGSTAIMYHSSTRHIATTCVWASEDVRLEIDPVSGVEKEVRTAILNCIPIGTGGLPDTPTTTAVITRVSDNTIWGVQSVMDKTETHCTLVAIRETELARSYRGRRL